MVLQAYYWNYKGRLRECSSCVPCHVPIDPFLMRCFPPSKVNLHSPWPAIRPRGCEDGSLPDCFCNVTGRLTNRMVNWPIY